MSPYEWIIKGPVGRHWGLPERRKPRRLLRCDTCGCEFVVRRKLCPACARRLRTDAA